MISIDIELAAEDLPAAELILTHFGAVSVSIAEPAKGADPIFEPPIGTHPLWAYARLTAYFEQSPHLSELETGLNRILNHQIRLETHAVDDTDWQAEYQRQFAPQTVGDELRISAPWHPESNAFPYEFKINPGIAFGTGTHPTTRLCLQWLLQHRPQANSILDFGCGSGILALCAYALGGQHITAVDIDPQALGATTSNIRLNGFPEEAFVVCTAEALADQKFDLILANILYTPLKELRNSFHTLLANNGRLVVSGILATQAVDLMDYYSAQYRCADHQTRQEWSLLEFLPRK